MIERIFGISEKGSTFGREVLGGAVTFMTMAYIISVQPALMSVHAPSWVQFGDSTFFSIMVATCLVSAFASLVMAFGANYPIALAPGMGINVLFAMMIGRVADTPQKALGVIFVAGLVFLLISLFRIRERIIDLISVSLKSSIAVAIGLFILLLGALNAFVNPLAGNNPPATFDLLRWEFHFAFDLSVLLVFAINLAIIGFLYLLRVPGCLLIALLAGSVVASLFGVLTISEVVAPVPSIAPTFFQVDMLGALSLTMIPYVVIFLFVDVFDTMGTLIGVAQKAGLTRPDGSLPRAKGALMADAVGTMAGSLCGVSTVTSYIESSAGVASGARTGLASVVTAVLFLAAMFFTPLWAGLSAGFIVGPVLIAVGLIMMTEARKIAWREWTEAVPAALTIAVMVAMQSIHHGLAAGFISYPVCKLLAGRLGEISWLNWVMAAVSVGMVVLVHLTV